MTTAPSTTTTTRPPTPAEAFASAARRLEEAGTFAYRGTANASDVSAVRPSLWLAFETTVDGQAQLGTGRLHEVAVAANGKATETVADGTVVWGRSADHRDALGERGFQRIPALSTPEPATKGVTNLPRWLAAAVAPAEAGVDPQGRRSYAATIPAAVHRPDRARAPGGRRPGAARARPAGRARSTSRSPPCRPVRRCTWRST